MFGKDWRSLLVFAVFVTGVVLASAVGGYVAGLRAEAPARPHITTLFKTDKTVMGEPIVYPTGAPAELTGAIFELAPGQKTPWHVHNVPLAGIVLEGEITVDYGARGTRTFKAGDALAEAMKVVHRGNNPSDKPVRIFVLYMGAKGVPNTTKVER